MDSKELILLTGQNAGVTSQGPATNSFGHHLESNGLLTYASNKNFRHIVCIDYKPEVGKLIKHFSMDTSKCTLIRMEPSVVLPANFDRTRRMQFGKVISVGGQLSNSSLAVHWPLVFPPESELLSLQAAQRSDRAVLINGNKISFIEGELYSLRRMAIKALGNLDVYGTEWDSGTWTRLFIMLRSLAHTLLSLKLPRVSGISLWFQSYPNSKGPVTDKLKTMSAYRYALVIENSVEYMSEKLMEALFAGCIPIYIGPNPTFYGIPRGLVVCAEPNIDSIKNAFSRASNLDAAEFHTRLFEFLTASATRDLWDHKKVYGRILEEIQREAK